MFMLILTCGLLHAQFGKSIGETIRKKVPEKAKEAIEKAIDATRNPETQKGDGSTGVGNQSPGGNQQSGGNQGGGERQADSGGGNNDNPQAADSIIKGFSQGYNFSDGVAWVRTGTVWNLIDKTGRILLVPKGVSRPASNFSHGVALVNLVGRPSELIDKTGKVISSPESGDYGVIDRFIPEIGMIVVRRQINTFERTETQVGLINNTGNWVVPLQGGRSFGQYLGEGLIRTSRMVNNSGVNELYNVFTGEVFEAKDGTWTSTTRFENGYGVFYSGNSISSTDTKGNIKEIITGVNHIHYLHDYREGLFFLRDNMNQLQGFYDINGNSVIDLSKYTIALRSGWSISFNDGYCVLALENDQKSPFYTVIDKTGKFMFEPRPRNNDERFRMEIQSGVLVAWFHGHNVHDYGPYGNVQDFSGNIIGDTLSRGGGSSLYFSEGAAYIHGRYYIDTTGKRLF